MFTYFKYSRVYFLLLGFLLFNLLVSCGPSPKLTRRYQSHTIEPQIISIPQATISAFSIDIPPTTAKTTLLNLSERGQAEFIKSLRILTNNDKKFLAALGSSIKEATSTPTGIDNRTLIERRIVFSVENVSPEPADRISNIKIILEFDQGNNNSNYQNDPKFVSWDKFTSEYQTIDLGKLKYVQGNEYGVAGSLKFPTPSIPAAVAGIEPPAELGASANFSRNLEEEIGLKQRFVVSSGQLNSKQATIIQQGVVGIDLTGNLTIDLKIRVKNRTAGEWITRISNLVADDGNFNSQDKVKVQNNYVLFPIDASQPITGKVKLLYTIRHVTQMDNTIAEGDDYATYISGTSPIQRDVLLVPRERLAFCLWKIVDENGRELVFQFGNDVKPIRFDKYDSAQDFLVWLNGTMNLRVGGRNLYLSANPLNEDNISDLLIKVETTNNSGTCG